MRINVVKTGLRKGFTLVELLVVIVVIIILATITATLYNNAQVQARDAEIRDAADKLADAIQLLSVNYNDGKPPAGGYGATALASNGKCADGSNGFVAYQHPSANYKCTVADAAVSAGYLNADFFNGLPPNSKAGYGNNKYLFMTYPCNGKTPRAWLLFFTQESPSTDETNTYNSLLTECGYNPASTFSQRDTYNMRGAVLIQFGFN